MENKKSTSEKNIYLKLERNMKDFGGKSILKKKVKIKTVERKKNMCIS